MPRPRARLAWTVAALVAVPLAAAAPAAAADPGYSITVAAQADGPAIADSMYGVFFEDINFAADGGLYAELVRNRSFEFLPVDNRSYTPLTAWTVTATGGGSGTAATATGDARLHERNRTYVELGLTNAAGGWYGVTNSGYNTGIALQRGRPYDFSVWARTDAAGGTP